MEIRHWLTTILILGACWLPGLSQQFSSYQAQVDELVKQAHGSTVGWQRLETICTLFPHRLSGSKGLENCLLWIEQSMGSDGFDSIHLEEVMVPHWERQEESLLLLSSAKGVPDKRLDVLALGGSVSTPLEGLTAEVLVVSSYEELEKNRDKAVGKIVVFDVPFTTYGETVGYRVNGASRAAEYGAVAALLSSVTPRSLATPHTGSLRYDPAQPSIAFAAITREAAQHFRRLQNAGLVSRVRLNLRSQTLPDSLSYNVIAEVAGQELPEEVVVLGGHIDGWDVGEGAQDDAGGCVMAWEALRLIVALDLKPRRTIRLVLWTNEENGLRGAKNYVDLRSQEVKNHVFAMESDYGTFHPSGFDFTGTSRAKDMLESVLDLLEPHLGPLQVKTPGGAPDLRYLMSEGVPCAGLAHRDERYFWYHHSPADTLDKIDPQDFRDGAALLAAAAFVVADYPERLPFGKPENKDEASK